MQRPPNALAPVICAGVFALAACSMDLDALQRAPASAGSPSTSPATDPEDLAGQERGPAGMPAMTTESGAGGAGMSGGPGASGAAASAGAPESGAQAEGWGEAPSNAPRPTCGVVGLPCCMPGNSCDLGACLRGKCTSYGGFYAETNGCTQNPCNSRNAYTAGCSCPAGFDDTLLWRVPVTCEAGDASTEVHSCTAARTPETMFGGMWVEGPDASCEGSCRSANPVNGQCGCPEGTQTIGLTVDPSTRTCTGTTGYLTLQMCIDPTGKALNFGGAYALSQSAALGCSTPNPVTAACSCPAATTTPQSLHLGGWSVFVCNL